jgi:hypothetical protein
MTFPKKLLLGAAARRALPLALIGALTPAVAGAADLLPAPMTHGAMGDGTMATMFPPPPATLNWTSLAPAGSFMLSYTPTFAGMAGNYIGDTKVSDATIASTIPSGQTHTMMSSMGKPMTMATMLRIVPDNMQMQMQGFNIMYGLTDSLTVMAMTGYVDKSMSMTTFKGMMGTTVLGTNSGTTDGLSDTMIGANYKLYQDSMNRVSFGLMFNLPTGSQTRNITMLSPMGSLMIMRAPYMMQSGTGTVDILPSAVYNGVLNQWSWGLAWRGRYALDNNPEGYHFGNLNEFHGWGGYTWFPGVTTTAHVIGSTQDQIHGADSQITGLSQNANPDYYGGQRVTLLGGVSLSGSLWGYSNSSLAVEAGGPVYQNLNGPQLGQAWQVTMSARLMF